MKLLPPVTVDRDIATGYDHASGPCIDPPEIDYRIETYAITFQLEVGDDIDAVKEILDDKVDIRDKYLEESELEFYTIDMRVEFEGPNKLNQLIMIVHVQEEHPWGRRAGTYEKISIYPR